MRAVVKKRQGFGIDILEVEKPSIQPDEVLIRVSFAGICGSDLHIYEWSEGYEWLKFPLIPGHEFSGEVVTTGNQVGSVQVGDRVTVSPHVYCGRCYYCRGGKPNLCREGALRIGFIRPGAFADFVAVPESSVFVLPENCPLDVAALTEPFCVALYALETAGSSLGNSVLIVGPGPIGLILVKTLKYMGISSLLIAGLTDDNHRLMLAQSLGADETIRVDKENLLEVVKNVTQGMGVDTVFEVSGSIEGLTQAMESVKKGGKIFMIGLFQNPTKFFFTPLVRREIMLQGVFNYTSETWRKAISLFTTKKIDLSSLITHKIPLGKIEEGFQLLKQKEAVKVLVIP
ncbi:alcohol dehydrogenase catalytic domain-containing protein [Candidatus Aerophobetes bacterium]|nr:alcohol dehydrogenase catalytic domain-containing protein [Candidatus Aerophobetes bacterium]